MLLHCCQRRLSVAQTRAYDASNCGLSFGKPYFNFNSGIFILSLILIFLCLEVFNKNISLFTYKVVDHLQPLQINLIFSSVVDRKTNGLTVLQMD